MAKKPSAKLGVLHHIGYGAADAGGVIMLVTIGMMNRYITNVLGISAEALALMLLIWNIWDMVNDPLIGTFMDFSFAKAKNKTNKFRPWILRSIPIFGLGLAAFFTVPNMFEGLLRVVMLFLMKIVFELGYTVMNIGMGSLLGVMATNDAERASLSSARGFGSTVGGMIGMMVIPQILSNLGETRLGYGVAGAVAAVLGGVLVFLHFAWTEERNAAAQVAVKTAEEIEAEKIKVTDIIEVFKVNRPYLALCIHSICICMVQGISQGAANYMYADVLGDIGLASIASVISMPVMFGGLIIAPILAKKWDLVAIIRTCLLVGIIGLGALFIYAMTGNMIPILYIIWSGVSTGLITLSVQLQWGLVGESIDYNEYLTGKRSEGSIYGVFSLTRRAGQTLSASLAVLMIDWFGYVYYEEVPVPQPDSAILGIKLMCILIPAIVSLGSWAAFKFIWDIDADKRAKVKAWKDERAARAAAEAEAPVAEAAATEE